MSAKTSWAFLFLVIIMSLSIGAEVPSLAAVKEEEVRQFIDEYKGRFEKMELDGFMALFSRDATENQMLPYTDIEEAYRRTVIVSRSRPDRLHPYPYGEELARIRFAIVPDA